MQPRRQPGSTEFRITVHLVVATDEARLEELRRQYRREQAMGVRSEWWSPDEVRAAEPAISPDAVGALSFPDHGVVDNRRLAACLAIAAAKRGVVFQTGRPVTGLLVEGDRVAGVDVCGERIEAGVVVNAAGSWAGLLAPEMRIPITPAKGQILALEVRPPLCRHIVSMGRGSLAPRADGRHVFGSTVEDAGYDKRVTAAGLQRLLSAAVEAFPALASATLVETWAGLRPVTPDHLPIIGAGPLDGYYVASGHFTMGILSAPATAEAMAGLIVEGRSPLAIDAFRPSRFVEGVVAR